MGSPTSFIILAACVLAARAAIPQFAIGPTDPSVRLIPSDSWSDIGAPGEFVSGARFLLNHTDQGVIIYKSSVASHGDCHFARRAPTHVLSSSTTFEFWGYQRPDGGLYNISFDGGRFEQIDAYNASATTSDGPKQLFVKTGLSNAVHSVKIVNVFDTRPPTPKFGQMNIDHFVITRNVQAVAPTFPANGFLAEAPLEYPHHISLSLGADSPANGGSGATVRVLLDSGAPGSWVVWSGCTEDACSGHNTYKESRQHFSNSSIRDTESYGSGGAENTFNTWRVNDTITFSNISILSTTLGAAFHIPSGTALDGNFGLAKGFCAGNPCWGYPNFVEAMYETGVIKSPVVAFYQFNSSDVPASGVTSKMDLGGIDRNKYIGSMDWIPITQDFLWTNPLGQRFVKGADAVVDATAKFAHTSLVFDTGSPYFLGIPTSDWNILLTLVGAKTVGGIFTLFPCTSSITFNFGGTENRRYTFPLINTTITPSDGFCTPVVYDAGNTDNWLAGTHLLDNYYVAFYYGEKGVGSTMGFGVKNLDSSAATASVVVGSA